MRLTIALVCDLKSEYESKNGLAPKDLIEYEDEDTIVAMEQAMSDLGHTPVRVGSIVGLVQALASREHENWDLVWNIAAGCYGTAQESQVPGLLEAWQIPYTFADAATMAMMHDKALAKMFLTHHGIPTAPFVILRGREPFENHTLEQWGARFSSLQDGDKVFSDQMPALFVRPCLESFSKGIYPFSKVHSPDELNAAVSLLRKGFPEQDLVIEPFLHGRELTTSILGTGSAARVLGTIEHVFRKDSGMDFLTRDNKSSKEDMQDIIVVHDADTADPQIKAAEQLALQTWRAFGCRDAGRVDIRYDMMGDQAKPFVLEVNAIASLRPSSSALPLTAMKRGLDYKALLHEILQSAAERVT